ncbi:zinc finger BED domain-containing protein 5-like [Palaemon carinicauda]|uniref:zinc finger BED domain-containing protein 5-like n=1 Tax=Palaemon carinicauda TaxID=392227 RepID=UPI0035B5D824
MDREMETMKDDNGSLLKRDEPRKRFAEYFERLLNVEDNREADITAIADENNKSGLMASYEVSRKIAVAKKPHNTGEQRILHCCKHISNVFGSSELDKLKHVSLSNDTPNFASTYDTYMTSTWKTKFCIVKLSSPGKTSKDIFNKVDSFFETQGIKWEHVGVCTDGAPVMLGCRSGFQTLVKQKSPDITGTHCTIHRQALVMKTMPDELSNVLDEVV